MRDNNIIQDAINCIKRLDKENAELKAENARLKEEKENLIEQLVIYNQFENSYNKYRQTLQEIKAIAETSSPYIDNFKIKTATEVGYDYTAICNELELRLHKVLELITKAESEDNQ